jgi:hypothetical protein
MSSVGTFTAKIDDLDAIEKVSTFNFQKESVIRSERSSKLFVADHHDSEETGRFLESLYHHVSGSI